MQVQSRCHDNHNHMAPLMINVHSMLLHESSLSSLLFPTWRNSWSSQRRLSPTESPGPFSREPRDGLGRTGQTVEVVEPVLFIVKKPQSFTSDGWPIFTSWWSSSSQPTTTTISPRKISSPTRPGLTMHLLWSWQLWLCLCWAVLSQVIEFFSFWSDLLF